MLSETGVRASRSSAVTWVMDHIIIDQLARSDSGRAVSLCPSLRQPYIHPANNPMATKEKLQEQWNYLYKEYLPTLAKARDEAQTTWPVMFDHCFARIVLDNSIGIDKPWTKVLPSPAYKHMSETQLRAAIALAEKIAAATANLVELDERSLQLRGKRGKKRRKGEDDGTTATAATATTATNEVQSANTSSPPPPQKKNRKKYETVSSYFLQLPSSSSSSPSSNLAKTANAEDGEHVEPGGTRGTTTGTEKNEADVIMSSVQVQRIEDSNMTAFKKQILKMLMQIPRGRYSTYGAMSDHLSTVSSKKTCARAVGSAIKNNPFAPEVCVNVMKLQFSAVQMRRKRRMMMIQADNMRA